MNIMMEEVRKQVCKLLEKDNSGHGMEHVDRVLNLSLKFAEVEGVDKEVVALIALLHDVDDYKIFGVESAENLTNAKKILEECEVAGETREQVLGAIKTIGYGKRLREIEPTSLEGMIVSDADMCDATGATGVLRAYQFALARGGSFFDKDMYPAMDLKVVDYNKLCGTGTAVNHMFEKMLRLKDLMLTESGRKEAARRYKIMVDFLYHFFEEQGAEEWSEYLDEFLVRSGEK